ncbi:MAG: hypothetical protein OEM77_04510 [Nitrosopumilus sp.]|nr:hypothetical protein [Nitrosopumilus sp.]MDH3736750.1 hypothetical protein [Nitrosopumilus sp.]MDH3823105.1 hypothetical protein [Nitrosopumilus sp.]MDH3834274.1 hypothetical protein [Nitrosopumilus sp.]
MTEKTEFIDFTIKKESWNRYKLEDGSELKTRAILVRAFYEGKVNTEKNNVGGNSKTIFSVHPSKDYNLFGPPNKNNNPNGIKNSEKTKMDYSQINEDWNVYELSNGKQIKFKLLVGSISRCEDVFDDLGVPVYNVQSQIVVHVE